MARVLAAQRRRLVQEPVHEIGVIRFLGIRIIVIARLF